MPKKYQIVAFKQFHILREFFFHFTYFVVVPDFNFFILRFFAQAYFDKYTEAHSLKITKKNVA